MDGWKMAMKGLERRDGETDCDRGIVKLDIISDVVAGDLMSDSPS